MSRPKGSRNSPEAGKPGRKPEYIPRSSHSDEEIVELKRAILLKLEAGEAYNLTQAADLVGVSRITAQRWVKEDKPFAQSVKAAEPIKKELLEAELRKNNSPIVKMFLVKKLDPSYRENAKLELSTEPLEKLLRELKEAGQKPVQVSQVEV